MAMPIKFMLKKLFNTLFNTLFNRLTLPTLLTLSLLAVGSVPVTAQTTELPELGDSASQYLNEKQAKVIGEAFFRALKASPDYIDDYVLRDYLQNLGDKIGEFADLRGTKLTFSLIQQNNLNAFAVPGGYITFNTGLLTSTQTESELASVVGHEIAHITQRHLPRLIAKSAQNRAPAIAAILGSILIGGQAGLIGITATNAALIANQLSYTRDFEREADAIGIKLLADSGYNPEAMASFFGKLERHTRHNDTDTLAFLRTHPLSHARVAEAETRAEGYSAVSDSSGFEYYLAKAKIRASHVERQNDPQLFFSEQMLSSNEFERDAAAYGAAIHLAAVRKPEAAIELVKPLSQKYPEHSWIAILHSELDMALAKNEAAIQRLEAMQKRYPTSLLVTYHLAITYLKAAKPKLAASRLRYQIRRNPDDFTLYKLLAMANVDLGNIVLAQQSEAEHYAILGDYQKAIAILKQALRGEAGGDDYLKSSIESRLTEFEYQQKIQTAIRES